MSDLSVILVPSDLQWPGWEEVLGPVFSTLVMHGSAAGLENWVQTPKARKLPPAWSEGSVTGLRARGGYEISVEWKAGKLVSATVKNISGDGKAVVRYGGKVMEMNLKKGQTKTLDGQFR